MRQHHTGNPPVARDYNEPAPFGSHDRYSPFFATALGTLGFFVAFAVIGWIARGLN